jgi:hypothetical protein
VDEDDRQFFRELLLRFDRKTEAMEQRSIREHKAEMAQLAVLKEQSDKLIAGSEASRLALLSILDRLDEGGGAAPAG